MKRALLALGLVVFCRASGHADGSAVGPAPKLAPRTLPPLSLAEALEMANQNSPLVRRALKEQAVAQATLVGARTLLPANPWIGVTLGQRRDYSSSSPPSAGFEVTGHLEQQFEIGGQRGLRMNEASRAIEVARIRTEIARLETRARVRAAYVGVLIARRQLKWAQEAEALGEQVWKSARTRLSAGAGTDIDRNLAEVEWMRLSQERVQASLGVEEALDRLRRELRLPAATPLELSSPLETPAPMTGTLEQLVGYAKARRADLKLLDAARTQLDAQLVRLRRERVPSPTLSFDVMSQQPGQLYLGGGVALGLPIWRRLQGELAITAAQREVALEDQVIFEDQLAIEVDHAQRVARALHDAAERWEQVALPAAERNVELVTQGWRSGKLDLFRVVQAVREAAEARRRHLSLLGALWDSMITLERVTGVTL